MEIPEPLEVLADVFPVNSLTLLHGIQGCGKSYSTIKALNSDNITPLYIAVENTTGLDELKLDYISPEILKVMIEKKDIEEIEGRVVIIDTYTRLHGALSGKLKDNEIVDMLEGFIDKYSITLIVIGHTRAFVGKDGIFDDNKFLPRNCTEELFLEKAVYKATKAQPARIEYNLHVNKGRGRGGSRIIPNWTKRKEK